MLQESKEGGNQIESCNSCVRSWICGQCCGEGDVHE